MKPSNTESNIALPPKSNGEEADKEQYKPIGIQTGYCVTYRLPSQIKLGQSTILVVGIGIEYDNRERAEGHFLITKFIDSNEATEALYEGILLIEGEESFEKKIDDTKIKKVTFGQEADYQFTVELTYNNIADGMYGELFLGYGTKSRWHKGSFLTYYCNGDKIGFGCDMNEAKANALADEVGIVSLVSEDPFSDPNVCYAGTKPWLSLEDDFEKKTSNEEIKVSGVFFSNNKKRLTLCYETENAEIKYQREIQGEAGESGIFFTFRSIDVEAPSEITIYAVDVEKPTEKFLMGKLCILNVDGQAYIGIDSWENAYIKAQMDYPNDF